MLSRDRYEPPDMYRAADIAWPITFLYTIASTTAIGQQMLSVNCPALTGNLEASADMGMPLWETCVAPATSFLTNMVKCDVYAWRGSSTSLDGGSRPIPGRQFHLATPRARTPVAVLHTGHTDRFAKRRFYFIGASAHLLDGAQLRPDGAADMVGLLAGWAAGLSGVLENAPFEWLVTYPRVYPTSFEPIRAPGFRVVRGIRLCQYAVPHPAGGLPVLT